MITVVLLAAGKSSRTSTITMKQLYRVKGEYLINLQIRTLQTYGFDVAVVLGHAYEKIYTIVDKSVTVVHHKKYEAGMFSSVKKAFKVLNAEHLIFCHIDRPIPDLGVFKALIQSDKAIAVAFYQGKKAPPIRIKSSMKMQLLNSDLKRLDHWIEAENAVDYVEIDDAKVHYNGNTDEEIKKCFNDSTY